MGNWRHLFLAGCLLLLIGAGHADEIWIALSDDSPTYGEVAAKLRDELSLLPRSLDFRIGPWQTLPGPGAKLPNLIIALGAGAFRGMVETSQRDHIRGRTPILAALLPRSSYESLAPKGRLTTSAVFLDQPINRYFDLLRLAFPDRRRVGVILGPDSAALLPTVGKAAAARGMQLISAQIASEGDDLYPALRAVLTEADILLALPEPHVFNPGALKNILLTTYRQRVPMVAFSAAYVKAGATLALNTTPDQVVRQTVATARMALLNGILPAPQPALEFTVAFNERVAHSLGLPASDPGELADHLRRHEGGR